MIPSNLKFSGKVESASARRYRSAIAPQSGQNNYAQGSTCIINIPTRNNTALIPSESLLKFSPSFTITAAGTTTGVDVACLDSAGAHNYIQRIRCFHGSSLLEDIDQYSGLAKILMDYQAPLDTTQGRFSVNAGTTNEYTGALVGADDTGYKANQLIVKPVNRGKNFIAPNATTANLRLAQNFTQTDTYSINLISLLGALSGSRYLPLWEMTSAPLRLEIVFQSSIENVMCLSPATAGQVPVANGAFVINNVEYIGEFIELPDAVISSIRANSSNPIQMVIPEYRNYQFSQTLTTSTTQVSVPIPAKFSSLKNIVVQTKATNGAVNQYPTASQNFNLNQYTFRIGSEVLPSNPVNTIPDFFNEACKCFGSLADMNYQPSIDINAYAPNGGDSYKTANITVDTYAKSVTFNSQSFLVGIDTETYQAVSKDSIFAGMNTNTSDIFFQPTHNGLDPSTICYYNMYACYDNVLVCENGVCYSRY